MKKIITIFFLFTLTSNAQNIYSVEYKSQADFSVYFVDYKSQADLKIFFVDYKSQAGWQSKEKKHLLY